ncbi:SDR family NAD(P)-dependent oxidoreductase, partial [Gammaproteobacteria bacterium]|nr:SDR family NAD(P)-dependent oxidoreductase [Gammaproteobacteria bacterium]
MKNTFENEVVYITGASAGIGYATAELCLRYGATVVITGRNNGNLEKAKQDLLKISSK